MAGITNPSCTDRLAKWTVPNAKTDLKPCPVSSMQFTKDHYKSFTTMDRSNQEKNFKARAAFSPLSQEQQQYIRNESQVRRDLMNIIKIHAPKSCFAELMSEKKLSVKSKEPTPKSIVDKADDFKVDKPLTMERNIENFTRACNLTENERDIINRNTVGQSSVNDWHDQRKGRVTASQFHRIYARSVTLQKHSGQDSMTLVSSLLGYKKIPDNAALKHGRSMEIHAKQKYIEINKRKHRNLKTEEIGLVVMKTKPYIAVSPDLKVKCNCCGEGLVEIKCPYSIKETIPSADHLDYLIEINDKVSLK